MIDTAKEVKYKAIAAEDNKANLMVLKRLLIKTNLETEFVNNGQQAIDLYISRPKGWHIIFMDCEMPIMDGYTATTLIRQYELKNTIPYCPIIGLSAHALPEFQKRALEQGMTEYITKPIDRDIFYTIIHKHTQEK